jgi:hypothetical protein
MSNAPVRARRLRELVRKERNAIKTMSLRIDARLEHVEALAEHLRGDKQAAHRRLQAFDARLKQLDEWRNEPVVLVRTSVGGYGVPVYHDSKAPCGYMWNRANFKPMLLAEAEEEGHPPCSACGAQASRRRIRDAA